MRLTFAPLPLAVLAAATATAQAPDTEEIVVTATRAARPLSTVPNTVTVIDETDLRQQISVNSDLSTILGNMIPSFSPSRQKLTSYGESLRGRDPLYMVDGVPQSNPLRDGSRDGFTIDPLMLERVEVIHGANSIHGLGASGGIINLITRRPADTTEQSLRVESFGQTEDSESLGYGLNYSFSGRWNSADMLASLSYRDSGVAYDADGNVVGFDNAQGDTMDSEMVNLFLKGGYDWSDQRIELTLNEFDISGNNDWIAVPGDIDAGTPTTAARGVMPGEPSSNEVTMFGVAYTKENLAGHGFRAQAFVQDFAGTYGGGIFGTFQDPTYGTEVFDQSQNASEKRGVKLTLVRDDVGGLPVSFVYGLDLLNDTTRQRLVQTGRNWVPSTEYDNTSLFAQAEYTGVDRLTLTTGIRYEQAKLVVDDFTTLWSYNGGQFVRGGNPDFDETLFNVGATYRLTEPLRIFANYSEGFSMPDVGRVLRGIDVPDQDVATFLDLTPIVTENTEIGFEYTTSEALSLQLAYYVSDSDFGQRLQANADGIYTVQREKTEIDGVELRAQWLVGGDDVLGLRYAHTDGQYDADDDGSVDTDLAGANMTPDRINLSWERSWSPRFSTRLQINHLLDRDFENAAGIVTSDFSGYTTADLSAEFALERGTINAGISNLTDEDYYTYYSQTLGSDTRNFKGFGRGLRLAYRAQF